MAVIERPAELTAPEPSFGAKVMDWLTTTDHKKIGILYIVTAFFFFVVAGIMALIIRAELAQPGLQIVSDQTYNQLFTMHGTIMIFLFVMPMFSGFANYLVPADDRRARRGVPADQRAVVLDGPGRRADHDARASWSRAAPRRPAGPATRRSPSRRRSSASTARTCGSSG